MFHRSEFLIQRSQLFIPRSEHQIQNSTKSEVSQALFGQSNNQDNVTFHERVYDKGIFKKENQFSFQME
ncbi:hypothetical protein J2Z83_002198 [Virgibacillus natechei]|uniref:Uncharacterized protein n=1 Tax=Virgibacillus natechei TaxID=1216297 RepID=A0ABS4IGK1_9BACI|nr:hypothetical protein [Virgibacillus natechei]